MPLSRLVLILSLALGAAALTIALAYGLGLEAGYLGMAALIAALGVRWLGRRR